MHHLTPRFCVQCGSDRVSTRIPDGDDHLREVCDNCGHIHYFNPKIVVGALPVFGHQVLLCKRAIEPRYGKWTLPAGFMEEGESLEQGAMRESFEEARAKLSNLQLYTVISLPDISQVYMLFRATLDAAEFNATKESLEVRLFDEADIPWDELAFRTIAFTLRHYFADRKIGAYPVRTETLQRSDSQKRSDSPRRSDPPGRTDQPTKV